MPTSEELEQMLELQMEPVPYDANDADLSILGDDGKGEDE